MISSSFIKNHSKKIKFFGLLVILVSVSQFLIASSQLRMGFFTDDWLFLSAYRAYFSNPILDLYSGWKALGAHWFPHSYYMGVLYGFFGLDYFSYRLFNQILKIIATLSLYPLVYRLSGRKFLAFFATLIYGIHFSTFGSLDGPSRGEDFLAIASMNLFLFKYISIIKKNITNILTMLGMTIWLAITVLIDDTRMFPLILILLVGDPVYSFSILSKTGLISSAKRISCLVIPFAFICLLTPGAIIMQLSYSIGRYDKLIDGNWQLYLAPFAAFGSTFLPKEVMPFFGGIAYDTIWSFLDSSQGLFFLFLFINISLGILTAKPGKFILKSTIFVCLLGLISFLLANHWLYLPRELKAAVDPGTYLNPSIIGLGFFGTSLTFLQIYFTNKKKNGFYLSLFFCSIFSLLFIFLTWIFADVNSIFMGVHAYLNIPAIGSSVYIAIILTLIYDKFAMKSKSKKIVSYILIGLIFVLFYWQSTISAQAYFSYWLKNGLDASDQIRIMDTFWKNVHYSGSNNDTPPVTYLDTSLDYAGGTFYSEVMIWKISAWFDVKYKNPKEGRFALCNLIILGPEELQKTVRKVPGENKLAINKCGPEIIYSADNFYAFKLVNKNIIPNKVEVLKNLGL